MSQTTSGPLEIIRKLLPYTTVAAVLALIYMGVVFYSRSSQNQELQREADQKAIEQARKTDELYGSGQLKILIFYATPQTVARGASTQLCYGVANATAVKMEPPVDDLTLSLNRCIPVKPARSTTYTLTASDDKGHTTNKTADVVIR